MLSTHTHTPPSPPRPPATPATTAADRDLDIYNCGAKHLVKGAGTTKEERGSFDSWMKEGGVADAFRRLHPDARGAYTYWSMRTNAVSSQARARTWCWCAAAAAVLPFESCFFVRRICFVVFGLPLATRE